jgi:transporter family-2 protein
VLQAPVRGAAAPALLAAGAGGALVALQARVNGQLGVALGDAVLAAVVSFAVGLGLVAAVVLARPGSWTALARLRQVPAWQRLGGLGGACLITASAAAAPVLGVALIAVALVAGQTCGGLLVDKVGLAGEAPRPVTGPRLAGAALCLFAVALAVPGSAGAADPGLLALVGVSGLLISVGAALNGRVRTTTGDAAVTTLVNFAVGLLALLLGLAAAAVLRGLPAPDWPGPGAWPLYTGGAMGAAFVALAAVVVRTLGVLRLSLAVVSGQVLAALVLDLVLPLAPARLSAPTVLGAVLTLVAVALSGRAPAGARA